MSKVYIIRCPDYGQVGGKMDELMKMMGGVGQFVNAGQRVAVKPNLLLAADPAKAVTTHPSVVAAIGRLFTAASAGVVLAESPGAGYAYDRKALEKTYRMCGMEEAAKSAGIELGYDTSYESVSFPEGKLIKRFEIISPIRKADCYVNVCKLKTHNLMFLSGGVKNLFGLIPGRTKTGYHSTMTTKELFAELLLDLVALVPPKLTIMDAVVGMEGEGPASGNPRQVGLLLASTDPLSLDVVASEIIGLPEDRNPLLLAAKGRGIHPSSIAEVEIIGIPRNELRVAGYRMPSAYSNSTMLRAMAAILPLLRPLLTVDPRILKNKCTGCGACKNSCPRDAISIRKVASIDSAKCIRCYCCHEMCRFDAIGLHKGKIYRMLNK
jgi:uncharacterized protein (DUF362 family)/NAD-dependent dihydropyrimidine dehydrogenase PreA subunit